MSDNNDASATTGTISPDPATAAKGSGDRRTDFTEVARGDEHLAEGEED